MKMGYGCYGSVCLGVAMLGACATVAADTYQIFDLGAVDNSRSQAFAINNTRQAVGVAGADDLAILWDNGSTQVLPPLAVDSGVVPAAAWDINSTGVIVGYSNLNSGATTEYHAVRWVNGVAQDLGTLGGSNHQSSSAQAINDNGLIVGSVETPDSAKLPKPALWANGVIDSPAGLGRGIAMDINNLGLAVGWDTDSNLNEMAFTWDTTTGVIQRLGSLGGVESHAYAVNESGQVVGASRNSVGVRQAFVWQNGSMTSLMPGSSAPSAAYAINESGQVVGQFASNAYLFENGQAYPLCDLSDCKAYGWTYLVAANGINDNGDIVGEGLINGTRHAFLMRELPTPVADLGVTQFDNPDPVVKGQPMTYAITATNHGPMDVPASTVEIRFSSWFASAEITPSQGACTPITMPENKRRNAKLFVVGAFCYPGAMASGTAATVNIAITPIESGVMTSTVSISADIDDPNLNNNSAIETTTVEDSGGGGSTCKGKNCSK